LSRCDAFRNSQEEDEKSEKVQEPVVEEKKSKNPLDDRLVRIEPKDRNRALDMGKGVHAMTPSESMRADEETGGSPYTKGHTDE
jgi:hypothetical protein